MARAKKENIIWDGTIYDFTDWLDDLREDYPDMSDDELLELARDLHAEYLDDERANLSVEVPGELVIIADLGLWNGRVQGIKRLPKSNISEFLYSQCKGISECKFYSNGLDICCDEYHHDGTNHYILREMRENRSVDRLMDRICNGETLSRATINYYTKSTVGVVNKVYGW